MAYKYTILIGSCARGTHDTTSDLDVVRIGHCNPIDRSEFVEGTQVSGPLTFIDYDERTFNKLYGDGSLFIHHILTEGRLVHGCSNEWRKLQLEFGVQGDFSDEIEENYGLYKWLVDYDSFVNAEVQMMSHLFRALKNLSIFSLAAGGKYVFEKRRAFATFLPDLPLTDVELLIEVNRIFERELEGGNIIETVSSRELMDGLLGRITNAVEVRMSR